MQKAEKVGTRLDGCVPAVAVVSQWTKAIGISCPVRMIRAALLTNEVGRWQRNLSHSVFQV